MKTMVNVSVTSSKDPVQVGSEKNEEKSANIKKK
jgi:hypothetical protein